MVSARATGARRVVIVVGPVAYTRGKNTNTKRSRTKYAKAAAEQRRACVQLETGNRSIIDVNSFSHLIVAMMHWEVVAVRYTQDRSFEFSWLNSALKNEWSSCWVIPHHCLVVLVVLASVCLSGRRRCVAPKRSTATRSLLAEEKEEGWRWISGFKHTEIHTFSSAAVAGLRCQ